MKKNPIVPTRSVVQRATRSTRDNAALCSLLAFRIGDFMRATGNSELTTVTPASSAIIFDVDRQRASDHQAIASLTHRKRGSPVEQKPYSLSTFSRPEAAALVITL